jgi:transposase-like protein
MALPEKRAEAEHLYASKSMSVSAIAEALEVDTGTVYRWKAEASEKGEARDWDALRRIYNLSPKELVSIYAEAVKAWVVEIKSKPETLSDPKIADALAKHVSNISKLDPRIQYLGAITDLIKFADSWLAKNEPELREKIAPYWDSIYQEMKDAYTKEGLF